MPKILLVDDDAATRKGIAVYLRSEGYEVDEAEDGQEAMDLLGRRTYDLVLSDQEMPKLTGMELLGQAKRMPGQTPFILMTSYATLERATDALRLGAHSYLHKPLQLSELKEKVTQAIEAPARPQAPVASLLADPELMLGSSLNTILKLLCESVEADGGEIFVLEPRSDSLIQRAAYGSMPKKGSAEALRLGQGLAGQAAQTGQAIGYAREICHPLKGERLLGVARVLRAESRAYFTRQDLFVVSKMADNAVVAIDNARAFSLLREEKQKLHTVLAQVQEAILWVDAKGRILFFNPTARQLTGVAEGEPGSLQEAFASFEARPSIPDLLTSGERAQRFEFVRRRPKELVLAGISTRLEPAKDAKTGGLLLVLRDVTLERREERISRSVLSLLSHKLRTPLAICAGFLEHLDRAPAGLPEAQRVAVKAIQAQTSKLGYLVDKLLLFAEAQNPEGTKLELARCSAREVVEEALAKAAERVGDATVEADSSALDALPFFQADAHHLAEALRNLIENAVKFNPRPGKERLTRVEASLVRDGEALRFSVTDNGPGIPEEEQSRLFSRFYQIDEHFTGQIEGLGLGLAYVKNIAQAHRGTTGLKSKPGQGSTFYFEVPLR